MRDYLLLSVILGGLPICFLRPYIGIYFWYWIALMSPHRFTWGIASHFPVAQYIGVATLLGFIFMKNRGELPKERETFILFALCILFTVNTTAAMFQDLAWKEWNEVMKIMLMTVMTLWIIDSKEKLRYLLFVVTLSVGVYAIKGVPWGIATGGKFLLWGPPGTFIGANNSLGLALNMLIPLMFFLARNENSKKVRLFYYGVFFSSIFGVILTYSRGSFLGLSAVLLILLVRSRKKLLAILGSIIGVVIILSYIPGKWFDRMHTIWTYNEDGSAMSRIETWKFAWSLTLERPFTGGGFQAFRASPSDFDAHSIYFGMLAEQGFIVFGLFALLIISCYWSLAMIKKGVEEMPHLKWYSDCASMLQVCIIAYLVNGLTLNRQYFDLFYVIVAIIIILKTLVKKEVTLFVEKGVTSSSSLLKTQNYEIKGV